MRSKEALQLSLGLRVRRQREELSLSCSSLAKMAGISAGMLSKIERGLISPSIGTLENLGIALRQPIGYFFQIHDENRAAKVTKAGEGIVISKSDHNEMRLALLGLSPSGAIVLEPFLLEFTSTHQSIPAFLQDGLIFIYVLMGELEVFHGKIHYQIAKGDSLLCDATEGHGVSAVLEYPTQALIVQARALPA